MQHVATKWHGEFVRSLPSMEGKTICITGTTTGLGNVAARDLVARGARVIVLNRASDRETSSTDALRAVAANGGSIDAVECDLQRFQSVRTAADRVLELVKGRGLDVLCNNAGVMALPEQRTVDGFDVQMQTNAISHFALTSKLMPALEEAAQARGEARVVNHSSMARKGPALMEAHLVKATDNLGGNAGRWRRYQQTKLANMVFGAALKDKLEARGSKVKVMAAAPGIASSQLASTTGRSGGGLGLGVIMRCAQSEEDGAMPLLECIARPGLESGTFVTPSHKGLIGLLWGDAVRGPPQSHLPESICTRESSKQLLWTCFESATGPFFR